MMTSALKIGELASKTDCPVQTIRYYEREGLLPEPKRTEGNYRVYGDAHLERLSIIRRCRSLDMSLGEIRTLLSFRDAPEENCAEVNALLDSHIDHVAARIAELKVLEKELKQLRQQCNTEHAARDCGILNNLATETRSAKSRKSKSGHVNGAHARSAN
jgi:Cd(II)/Pb(II)-responsive transcriptional regulator